MIFKLAVKYKVLEILFIQASLHCTKDKPPTNDRFFIKFKVKNGGCLCKNSDSDVVNKYCLELSYVRCVRVFQIYLTITI